MVNENLAADGTMRAARFHGRGDIRVERIPVPELKPGHVAIDVAYSGICGSDLHEVSACVSASVSKPHARDAESEGAQR